MADPVKRLRYFDGEFLRAADLQAEQTYHLVLPGPSAPIDLSSYPAGETPERSGTDG
jgi:hypothetical protein